MAFEERLATPKQQAKDFDCYPSTCNCGAETAVALATVINRNTGQLKTGPASEFSGRDNNNNPNGVLQDWWELRSYRGYCTDCYEGFSKPGQRKYTDKQVRYAWQWLLGEICSGGENVAMAGAFKRMKLTDSQRDTALEIVNHEARRTNQPGSVPTEYRFSEETGI